MSADHEHVWCPFDSDDDKIFLVCSVCSEEKSTATISRHLNNAIAGLRLFSSQYSSALVDIRRAMELMGIPETEAAWVHWNRHGEKAWDD